MSSGRVLAVDLGSRRAGLALSDATASLASPLDVLPADNRDKLLGKVAELTRKHDVDTVVVGFPVTMSGSVGEQARLSQKFASDLSKRIPAVKVVTWDERLSSVAAERALREAGSFKRGRTVDKEAAALFLQAYLDWRKGGGAGG